MKPSIEKAKLIDFRVRVPEALRPKVITPEENKTQYNAVLSLDEKLAKAQTLDDLLNSLNQNNIDHAILHAEYEVGDIADELNRVIADSVEKHPDRLTGIGTISQENLTIKTALKQIDQCIEMGFIGLSIQPAFFGFTLDDKRLYPVYAKAMENNLLVALHTGINYTTHRPMSGENPMLLDQVACDFPDLTLVASHAGWPWIAEMVAVARKHPNIFMEFGGLAPKYIAAEGSGWEMMYRFMNSVLSQQILFGSDWPAMDQDRAIKEWHEMGLKPAVLNRLFVSDRVAL